MKWCAVLITAVLLGVFAAADADARTFQWTDETGHTHFTQVPAPSSCDTVSCRKTRGSAASPDKGSAISPVRKNTGGRKAPTVDPRKAALIDIVDRPTPLPNSRF